MKITADQILQLASLMASAVQAGKVALEEIIAFFESKGADADQIAKARALLTADIAAIDTELKGDGAK